MTSDHAGSDPTGFHAVNVALHALVCLMFHRACKLVFGAAAQGPSLVAAVLYATHPIHVEVVANVVGRGEMLAAVFFLASLFAFHQYQV